MILEIARFVIKDGMEAAFEQGVGKSLKIFSAAQGFASLKLYRCIESPAEYRLLIEWETLEDHTETFRNSPGFQKWRKHVGDCFAEAPIVEHASLAAAGPAA